MRPRSWFSLSLFALAMLCLSPLASAQAVVSLSPTSLGFGNQQEGIVSAPQTVTLTNTGNATLNLTKVSITGANAADYAVSSNNCGTSVLAGANCAIAVTFDPTKGGPRSANLTLADNAANSPQLVPLSGNGLAPAVTFVPPALTFADQLISTSSNSQSITVTNIGQAPLAISSIAVTGVNGSDYSQTNNCGTSLAINATCQIAVIFTPSFSWSRTAALMMTDNAQGSPHVMGLAGNGASGGVASFSPSSLTFATTLTGNTSVAQTVTLNNTGTAALQIANISTAGDYIQTNNCGSSVAALGSCTINVSFVPTFSAARPGWINVNFTDPAGLQTVTLSGTGALPAPVAVKPRASSVTPTQTQQYTAYLSNVVTTNVTWYVDGVAGGSSTVGPISTTGLYTPPAAAGTHTVKAVNNANTRQSASVPVIVSGYAGTLTHHNDTFRTGQNNNEGVLTTGRVNKTQFAKLFTQAVDGQVYAEPLWVPSVNISGQGFHNVVFVATEHDSVYAFDGDQSGPALWHTSFINPALGVTSIPKGDVEVGLDLSPEVGITSTPVIDAVNGILYVEARTKDVSGTVNCSGPNSTSPYFHYLHALNITTGGEMPGSPVMVCAQVSGTGYDNSAGVVYFNPMRQNQRPAMLLLNGVVYMGFGALEDIDFYHGWVLAYTYSAGTFSQVGVFNDTPNGSKGGIWQSGGGLLGDASGNVYFSTGNGTFDANKPGPDYGMSFVKLTLSGNTLSATDYFSPFNQAYLSLGAINADLASAGPMLFPDQSGPVTHLALACGKTGTLYLMNRDNLGKFNASSDNVVQAQYTTIGVSSVPTGNWGTPAYFNGQVYLQGIKDPLKQYEISNSLLSGGPIALGADVIGYPGTVPVVSSNGTQNGIVWVVQSDGAATNKASTLRAYDAANIAHELYNSGQSGQRDLAGPAVKFATPTVANGKVYVPTASELDIYGLLP
jgi:hypothetical protein